MRARAQSTVRVFDRDAGGSEMATVDKTYPRSECPPASPYIGDYHHTTHRRPSREMKTASSSTPSDKRRHRNVPSPSAGTTTSPDLAMFMLQTTLSVASDQIR